MKEVLILALSVYGLIMLILTVAFVYSKIVDWKDTLVTNKKLQQELSYTRYLSRRDTSKIEERIFQLENRKKK